MKCNIEESRKEHAFINIVAEEERNIIFFGLSELEKTLRDKGFNVNRLKSLEEAKEGRIILVGNVWNKVLRELQSEGMTVPGVKDSFTIRVLKKEEREIVVVCGKDDAGTMYGALDLAEEIELSDNPVLSFPSVRERSLSPFLKVRGVNFYITREALENDGSWFHAEAFWESLFDMMARCRFNFLDLHCVWEASTGYVDINIFPYLVRLGEYPQVAAVSDEQLQKNMAMLKAITEMARARGIEVCLANQMAQVYSSRTSAGLNEKELIDYTRRCVKKLLDMCPDLETLGIRVAESGKGEDFYRTAYLLAIEEAHRPVHLIMRTWGAKREKIVEVAEQYPGKFSVEIKYNGEQLGLPYHAVTSKKGLLGQDPTYSYEDYTNSPRKYSIIWQIRANGTHRIFRWGDPVFVKRSVESCLFGDGVGFSLECLSNMIFQEDMFHSDKVDHGFYKWNFERDWFWFLLWGRLAYDPHVPEETWIAEFNRRFGEESGRLVYEAYVYGSKIVPLIYAYRRLGLDSRNMAPELESGGNLDSFVDEFVEQMPLDINIMQPIREYVDARLNNEPSGKMTPLKVCRLLAESADNCLESINEASTLMPGKNKEFECTKMDMDALYHLAHYYREKILAAVNMGFYLRTREKSRIELAEEHIQSAVSSWKSLASVTEVHYRPFFDFHMCRRYYAYHPFGFHWKREARTLRRDLNQVRMGRDFAPPMIDHKPIHSIRPQTSTTITAFISDIVGVTSVTLHYKPIPAMYEWSSVPMTGESGVYSTTIPGSQITSEGIMYYIEAVDKEGNGAIYPDPLIERPYIVVKAST